MQMDHRVELNTLGEGAPEGIQIRREDRDAETISCPEAPVRHAMTAFHLQPLPAARRARSTSSTAPVTSFSGMPNGLAPRNALAAHGTCTSFRDVT